MLQKEKVLLTLDELKSALNPLNKDNKRTYAKKEEKTIHMANKPALLQNYRYHPLQNTSHIHSQFN